MSIEVHCGIAAADCKSASLDSLRLIRRRAIFLSSAIALSRRLHELATGFESSERSRQRWIAAGRSGQNLMIASRMESLRPFAEVDLVAVEVGDGGAVDFFRDEGDEFFGEVHQVVVVGVGLVELEHGELGVVLGADAFVAEVAVDLVDAVEAADDEALEVELGRDAQGEVDVERVVVGGEGAGGGAAGDGVHHGGFDFEVAAVVEEVADGAEDGGALDEDFADVARVSDSEVRLLGSSRSPLAAMRRLGGGRFGRCWSCEVAGFMKRST